MATEEPSLRVHITCLVAQVDPKLHPHLVERLDGHRLGATEVDGGQHADTHASVDGELKALPQQFHAGRAYEGHDDVDFIGALQLAGNDLGEVVRGVSVREKLRASERQQRWKECRVVCRLLWSSYVLEQACWGSERKSSTQLVR